MKKKIYASHNWARFGPRNENVAIRYNVIRHKMTIYIDREWVDSNRIEAHKLIGYAWLDYTFLFSEDNNNLSLL